MAGKFYKQKKRVAGRFVQLSEYLLASEAWADRKSGPRALYIELKRRFYGSSNGKIVLSHRNAGKALNVHRNTVGPWFDELIEHGFIHMMQGPHLGPSGIGHAAHYALDELQTPDLKPTRKAFTQWRKKQDIYTSSHRQ